MRFAAALGLFVTVAMRVGVVWANAAVAGANLSIPISITAKKATASKVQYSERRRIGGIPCVVPDLLPPGDHGATRRQADCTGGSTGVCRARGPGRVATLELCRCPLIGVMCKPNAAMSVR